jgi:hypothetical protein
MIDQKAFAIITSSDEGNEGMQKAGRRGQH